MRDVKKKKKIWKSKLSTAGYHFNNEMLFSTFSSKAHFAHFTSTYNKYVGNRDVEKMAV